MSASRKISILAARDFLEKLYLGTAGRYRVLMPHSLVKQVERIFDEVIAQHGWRNVEFEYVVMNVVDAAEINLLTIETVYVPSQVKPSRRRQAA